jgi:hypothetical protein
VPAIRQLPLLTLPCVQAPLAQVSKVQATPSSGQELPSPNGAWSQVPLDALQTSKVQGLPSSQPLIWPLQLPAKHTSPVVHALPSLHSLPRIGALRQPFSATQTSLVQGFLSSHVTATPLHQLPAQLSWAVQASPSSQGSPTLALFLHPPDVQTSSVHGLPSEQLRSSWQGQITAPPKHSPLAH